jgi:hypothetical protein
MKGMQEETIREGMSLKCEIEVTIVEEDKQ